ncbi:MAG: ectonucleotide pyrophosphatase/phosphodiesterase [Melioribacteraceae bacterium]|nr:ectonucleotide pyrophosphatase/phosphodiesterase [Melioribacteraceae bacterium]
MIFIFFLTLILSAQPKPYVLLVSFDGFRWDYLNRDITPNLNEVINNGVRASSLRPVFPSKTFPNHLSIITGMFAENHGIIFNHFENVETTATYSLSDSSAVRNPDWYKGEAFWTTAEKNGIKTASFFWPGSELNDTNRRPTYFKKYEHNLPYKERIDGVIDWLKLPQNERPHFITLYFDDTDTYGHEFGPNSPEINKSIKRLDGLVGYLNEELLKIGMKDSLNIIFVSDHGMTEVAPSRAINLENILKGFNYKIGGTKTVTMIEPNVDDFDSVYARLDRNQNHFKLYKKESMPEYYHFNKSDNIYSILLVAELGWSIVNNRQLSIMSINDGGGNHGFDNNSIDMHAIFVANGPNFKAGYKTGSLWNIDIYPLLCKIFNIEPNKNIDGKLERIEFILSEKTLTEK